MKINLKPEPRIGDTKVKRKFILFPRIHNDCIYWLGTYDLHYKFGGKWEFGKLYQQFVVDWHLMDIKEIEK